MKKEWLKRMIGAAFRAFFNRSLTTHHSRKGAWHRLDASSIKRHT
jgi:hypothetical protein